MAQLMSVDKSVAEAISKFTDYLYDKYSGIKIKEISAYEDEDFAFEITIPENFLINQVLETCNKECIKIEDEYDLFILPNVVYEK